MRRNLKLSGCGTALVTPFKGSEVDYDGYVRLLDRQVKAGVHFLVPLGTTGETPCLETEERLRILRLTKEHCAGLPVVVGGGTNSLAQTLAGIRRMEEYAPDAYLIVVPYYNKPTQAGLYEYFKAVAESTDKGIVLYNVPGRTGANMTAETTLKLAGIPNIIAVKEASGNYAQISEIIRNAPDGFSVLSGNDGEMVKLTEALLDDDIPAARALHHRLTPLFRNCFVESNPIPVKAAMSAMGLMENILRLPLVPASANTTELMKRTLAALDIDIL